MGARHSHHMVAQNGPEQSRAKLNRAKTHHNFLLTVSLMDQIERGATIFEEHDVESTDLAFFHRRSSRFLQNDKSEKCQELDIHDLSGLKDFSSKHPNRCTALSGAIFLEIRRQLF